MRSSNYGLFTGIGITSGYETKNDGVAFRLTELKGMRRKYKRSKEFKWGRKLYLTMRWDYLKGKKNVGKREMNKDWLNSLEGKWLHKETTNTIKITNVFQVKTEEEAKD